MSGPGKSWPQRWLTNKKLFKLRMHEHELSMLQMAEEISQGQYNIEQAAKFEVHRKTVNIGCIKLGVRQQQLLIKLKRALLSCLVEGKIIFRHARCRSTWKNHSLRSFL